jgi:uncharacterized membrane protein
LNVASRRTTLVLLLIGAAACGPPEPPAPPAIPVDAGTPATVTDADLPRHLHLPHAGIAFHCGSDAGFVARSFDDSVRIHLADRTLHLPRVESASGSRFASRAGSFWERDGEAVLELDGTTLSGCRADVETPPWQAARQRGVQFRAIGQEPGWHLEVTDGERIQFVGDYGETTWSARTPHAAVSPGLSSLGWSVQERGESLHVHVTDEPCFDVMSGEPYPSTVTVRFRGSEHRGCGRFLR